MFHDILTGGHMAIHGQLVRPESGPEPEVFLAKAIIRRATADAEGKGLGDVPSHLRQEVQQDATEFLGWLRSMWQEMAVQN